MDTGFAVGKVWEFLAKSVNMSKIAWKGILHVRKKRFRRRLTFPKSKCFTEEFLGMFVFWSSDEYLELVNL